VTTARERAIDETIARAQIRECLARYCHGIDRCDVTVLKSAYWPDAYEEHGTFDGPAWDFADHMTATMHLRTERSMQMIGNVMVEFDNDLSRARVETYVFAFLRPVGESIDRMIAGRYLDRFERRGEEWRILRRLYVLDWHRDQPSAADAEQEGLYAMLRVHGARHPADPWDAQRPDHRPRLPMIEVKHG
jgi:hypothetical protein